MKTKIKRTLYSLLVSILILNLLSACNLISPFGKQWVRIKEVIEYDNGDKMEKNYQYDSSGKIIGMDQKMQSDENSTTYKFSNLLHDNSGNLISYTLETIANDIHADSSTVTMDYTFTYDKKGNCIASTASNSTTSSLLYEMTAEYDENGQMTISTYNYYNGSNVVSERTLTYSNDLLIQAETVQTTKQSGTSETSNFLARYYYDDNNNLSYVENYKVSDKTQYKTDTTYYTWERLDNIANNTTSDNKQTNPTIYIEPTTATQISDWGFYNLDEMGNILVEITGYNLSADEPYVYFAGGYSHNIFGFDNGYASIYNIDEAYNLYREKVSGPYTIIDNDSIYINGYDDSGSLTIKERKTRPYKNFIAFVFSNNGASEEWYVPYSLIDWDRGVSKYESEDGREYPTSYKFYLK